MKLHANALPPGATPHTIRILLETILKNNLSFMEGIFSNSLVQRWEPKPPHHTPTFSWVDMKKPGSLHLGHSLPEQIHRQYLLDISRYYRTAPVHEKLHKQPPPRMKFTFEDSAQEISLLDMKIYIGTDHKLSTTLNRKPTDCLALLHFHSNHSLNCKESIAFSQVLSYNLLIADDTLLQKELCSLAISLLARQYRLEGTTPKISKALLLSRDALLYKPLMAGSPKTLLPIVTPYSPEGRHFFQSVQTRWHITEKDQQLQNIWPNHPITAYHKTESLRDMLVHSCQTKPTSPHSVPNEFCQ